MTTNMPLAWEALSARLMSYAFFTEKSYASVQMSPCVVGPDLRRGEAPNRLGHFYLSSQDELKTSNFERETSAAMAPTLFHPFADMMRTETG